MSSTHIPTSKSLQSMYWSLESSRPVVISPAVHTATRPKVISILAVTASSTNREYLRQLGARYGWQLHQAQTLREVWAFLLRETVSVVVCDEELPGGCWRDVASEMAAMTKPPALVVLSEHSYGSNEWDEAGRAGGVDVFAKAGRSQELEHALLTATRHYSGQQEEELPEEPSLRAWATAG